MTLNFSCIASHLIHSIPPGIYVFKVNNAGWENWDLYGFVCNSFKLHLCSFCSQNLSVTTQFTME